MGQKVSNDRNRAILVCHCILLWVDIRLPIRAKPAYLVILIRFQDKSTFWSFLRNFPYRLIMTVMSGVLIKTAVNIGQPTFILSLIVSWLIQYRLALSQPVFPMISVLHI